MGLLDLLAAYGGNPAGQASKQIASGAAMPQFRSQRWGAFGKDPLEDLLRVIQLRQQALAQSKTQSPFSKG